jgi:GC-rich sequence DNA-binding factor
MLAVTNAYDVFYLHGDGQEEVVYKYYTDVRTAVLDPHIYASQFVMRADLHIRNDKSGNGTVFWLEHIEVYAYNGEKAFYDHEIEHWSPLPEESKDFFKPFYVGYYESGLAHEIMFMKDEPEWTINVKKAIASLVQLDWTKVTKEAKKTPYAFHTYEYTIYGKCDVSYEIIPHETEYIVTKYMDPKHCDGHVEQLYTNIVPTQCHADHDESYRTPNKKIFHLTKDGILKEIKSSAHILMYPFKHQDNIQVVSVNQTIEFVKYVKPEKQMDFNTFQVYYPLKFMKPHVDENVYVPDITFGRKHFDVESHVPKVKEMFYEAVEYLQSVPINSDVPDTKQGLVMNRILRNMKYFDVKHFEAVFALLQKGTAPKDVLALELFYKMLPNIGTRPVALFIKNIIAEHKVKDYIATSMLYTLGVNMHVPTEKLLTELEEFIHWEDKVKPEVWHAAVLSYGTLIYETYHEHESDEHVEKYIKIYYNKLKEAKTYEAQLIWLQGLANIRIGSVYELFRPIVLGEPVFKYDRHLRVHAIWNILEPLQDKHIEAFETLWPVMADKDLHIELRVASLKAIMRTASVSQLSYIFQHMQEENCPHLYSYFYTAVKSMAHSEIYCDLRTNITTFAEQVEQYFQNSPVHVGTSAWVRDYHDEDYDYGFSVYGNSIANEKTNEINQVYMRFNTFISNNFYNNLAVHFKFEGIEFPLETVLSDLFSFSADTFKGHLLKRTDEPVHVEIIITHHEQVVFVKYFDEAALKDLFAIDFIKMVSMMKYQFTFLQYELQGEVTLPTDFGFPAQFYVHMPYIVHYKKEVPIFKPDEHEVVVKTNKFLRIWRHGEYGVKVYNPMVALLQGARRVLTLDVNIPISLQLTVNYDTKSVKFAWEKHTNDAYNVFGIKTHVSTQVLSIPDKTFDILTLSCKDCHQYVTVTRGEEFKHDTELFDSHTRFNGKQYHLTMYDCEYTPQEMKSHGMSFSPMSYDFLSEIGHIPFKKVMVHMWMWMHKNAYIAPHGSCGLVLFARPCPIHGHPEHYEFTFKFDKEMIDHHDNVIEHPELHHVVVPNEKHIIKVGIVTKDHDEKIITEYQGDIGFKHMHGNLFTDLEIHFSRKIHGDNDVLNWCFEHEKTFLHDKIDGHYKFWYGHSHKHECVKDDFNIQIEFEGVKSKEQLEEHVHHDDLHTYTECQPHLPWDPVNETTYDCMYAHTTVRHYWYFLSYQHVPKAFEYYFENLWHWFKISYAPHFEYNPEYFTGEHNAVVEMIYPVAYHEPVAHVAVNFDGHTYTFEDFPTSNYWWFAQPESVDIPLFFRYAKYLNEYSVCSIYPEEPHHYLPHHHLGKIPTKEWQLYAADHKTNYTWAVYVQKADHHDEVSVKFVLNDHWMIIKPKHDDEKIHTYGESMYSFVTDNKMMKYITNDYESDEMYGLKVFYVQDGIFFTVPDLGMIWTYDGHFVRVITLDVDHEHHKYHGECYH